jgi:hypothetical protein
MSSFSRNPISERLFFNTTHLVPKTLRRRRHNHKLLMLFSPVSEIPRAFLELHMHRHKFYRNKLLLPFSRYLPCNIYPSSATEAGQTSHMTYRVVGVK